MSMETGSQNFALDMQSVAKLKYSAQKHPEQALKKTAQQFEAMFLQQMLEKMRDAIPKSDLTGGKQMEMYQSLMDKQWGETLSKRGIGLADMLTRQLSRQVAVEKTAADPGEASDPLASIARAAPQQLAASAPLDTRPQSIEQAGKTAKPAAPLIEQGAGVPLVDLGARGLVAVHETRGDQRPDYMTHFVDRMGPAAERASRETGISSRLILAQAALETGWGRHETARADGNTSFNVFNIKAGSADGPSTSTATHEYVDGKARATHANFRVYDSYDEAFADYARLLSQSPRYGSVVNAPDANAAARELQTAGYATDPNYADKLVSIISALPRAQALGGHGLFADADAGALVDTAVAANSNSADSWTGDISYRENGSV